MSKFTKVLLPVLLLTLSACNNANENINENSIEENLNSSETQNAYKIVLPNIDGIEFEVSNPKPQALELVKLYVRNLNPDTQRINSVELNNVELLGLTSENDLVVYEFQMPANADATITAEVVEVYAVNVDSEIQNRFTLTGIDQTYAEGEVVTFMPAAHPGFWFKSVAAVEEDVVLTKNDDGSYSFVMPAHAVTITAVTGENVYAVTAEDTDYYRFNGVNNNQTFSIGEEVKFRVNALGYDTVITGVFVDGVELVADADGYYSFLMPTYGVTLTATYDIVYRTVVGVDSEHFTLSLTTVVNEEEVAAGNNVLAEQVVYVEATEKPTETPHNFIVSGFVFEAGEDADSLSSSGISLSEDAEGRQYFKMPTAYKYVKVSIEEIESEFKYSPLVGTYNGYRPYYSYNQTATIDIFGNINTASSDRGTLTKVEGNHYTSTSTNGTTYNYYIDEENQIVLYVDSDYRGGSYLYKKTDATIKISSSDKSTYSLRTNQESSTDLATQFYHITYSDGTVVTCYYDFVSQEAYFGVTATLVSGVDGQTNGDIVVITSSDGVTLNYYKITKTDSYSNGYQHQCETATPDAYIGTYDGELGQLELNGYGVATLVEESGTYVVDNGVVVVTIAETNYYFNVETETHTYTITNEPTDGLEGTYSGELGELVLDGYGVATLAGESGTYTVEGTVITINLPSATYTVSLSGSEYLTNSKFSGYVFSGTYYDEWDEANSSVSITFDVSPSISGTLKAGYMFTWSFTATFDEETNTLTLTVVETNTGSSYVGKVITATLEGNTLTLQNDFNTNTYTFEGAVLTCDDFPGL